MKYEVYLKNHIIEKWKHYYVNYSSLKRSIKNKNHIEFWKTIHNELEKINIFYNYLKNNNESQEELNEYIVLNYMAFLKQLKSMIKDYVRQLKLNFLK